MSHLRLLSTLALGALLLAALPLASAAHEGVHHGQADGKTYGKALTEELEVVPISKILAAPDDYVDKPVKIEGRVVNVCAKRGCWMELAGDEEFQSMRVKVDDGVIVFPMEAKGHMAVAEGVFQKFELTMEQTVAMKKHECEEKGEKFDEASCTKPGVVYQVAGLGAVIFE